MMSPNDFYIAAFGLVLATITFQPPMLSIHQEAVNQEIV